MKGSWKLGRFAGVDAYVHWTFGLLVAWAGWSAWQGAGSVLAVMLGLAFLFAVFGSVLLHELGHALVARRYGVRTHNIVLTPIGGMANLDGIPAAPRAELAIALAGPAVNVVIAAGLALLSAMGFGLGFGLMSALMWANISLALFNLIPAFPMDGGRALRAWLATRMGKRAATGVAVSLGKVIAIAMAIVGLFTNPMLLLVAVFVWFAGSAESRAVEPSTGWWEDDGVRYAYDEVAARRRRAGPPQVLLINGRLYYR